MKRKTTYRITVDASTKNLGEVREFVAEHSREQGFSDRQINDLKLAVDEAYTNIIKHAYHNDDSQQVEISLEFDERKLCVILSDHGVSFNVKKYEIPDIREQIKKKKRGGMGVYLIHTLMDDVTYRARDSKNEIRMYKNRP